MKASGFVLAWVAVQTIGVREAPRAKTIAKKLKIHALQLRSPPGALCSAEVPGLPRDAPTD